MIDLEGEDFYLPEANIAFCETLKSNLREDIKVVEMDCEINDSVFAVRCADELMVNLK